MFWHKTDKSEKAEKKNAANKVAGGVVVRTAPSPTGLMHVGTARTALFNYLFAKQQGGKHLLRIEDTDKGRSKKEFETDLIESIAWLGLSHDGEITRQSERGAIYKNYIEKLVAEDKAYISKEAPKEPGERAEVIRFRNPNKTITFTDLIRGEITFDTTELKDFIIAKSVDEPIYHLTVVIDDHEMGVTHVIRGEDHISNTPRQILIQEAIGASRPIYAHLPLILAADKSKLSKRKHGESVSVSHYRNKGYLPEAIINFLALLGWNPGNDQEIINLDELIQKFDLSKVQKSGAIFNLEKLNWLNHQYILKLPQDIITAEIQKRLAPESLSPDMLSRIVPVIMERISTWDDVAAMKESGELDYLFKEPVYETTKLLWKGEGDLGTIKTHLATIQSLLDPIKDFTAASVKDAVWPYAEKAGRGAVLWPFRYTLSGKDKSPDPFQLAEILGKEKTLARLSHAQKLLS